MDQNIKDRARERFIQSWEYSQAVESSLVLIYLKPHIFIINRLNDGGGGDLVGDLMVRQSFWEFLICLEALSGAKSTWNILMTHHRLHCCHGETQARGKRCFSNPFVIGFRNKVSSELRTSLYCIIAADNLFSNVSCNLKLNSYELPYLATPLITSVLFCFFPWGADH